MMNVSPQQVSEMHNGNFHFLQKELIKEINEPRLRRDGSFFANVPSFLLNHTHSAERATRWMFVETSGELEHAALSRPVMPKRKRGRSKQRVAFPTDEVCAVSSIFLCSS